MMQLQCLGGRETVVLNSTVSRYAKRHGLERWNTVAFEIVRLGTRHAVLIYFHEGMRVIPLPIS